MQEDVARVPVEPTSGRSLVTRRAIIDIVRAATLGSYGVTGFAGGGPLAPVLEMLGFRPRGIRLAFHETIEIELDVTVAYGLPIAEVARQVDSAIRYSVRRALGLEVDRLTIHVDGLAFNPGGPPPTGEEPQPAPLAGDLADRGTDLA